MTSTSDSGLTRRALLRNGALAAAGALALPRLIVADQPRPPPYRAVVDRRFAPAMDFADVMAVHTTVRWMAGDLTAFWLEELEHRWRQSPAVLVGMTDEGTLHCLQILAHSFRMDVLMRCEHHPLARGQVEHRFSGPVPDRALERSLSQERWPRSVARLAHSCATGGEQCTARIRGAGGALEGGKLLLTSWVIAPIAAQGSFGGI